jgi:putative transposase
MRNFSDSQRLPFIRPKTRGELPHLYKEGGTYFVTFRLFDAIIPRKERAVVRPRMGDCDDFDDLLCLLEDYDPPIRLGSCLLFLHAAAEVVQNALRYFDGQRYELITWCVMPNHVHTIFTPMNGHQPDGILHSWKSYTSHAINKLLNRSGTLWERESFDHLIRSMGSLERLIRYTEANPVEAGLCGHADEWPFSSASHTLMQDMQAGCPDQNRHAKEQAGRPHHKK